MKKWGTVYRNRCWGAGKRCMLASAKHSAFLLELQCVTVMVSLRLLITSEMETISLAWEVSCCCSLSAVKVLRSNKGLIWEKGGRNRQTVWPVITYVNSWVTLTKKQRIHHWVLFRYYIMQNMTEEKLEKQSPWKWLLLQYPFFSCRWIFHVFWWRKEGNIAWAVQMQRFWSLRTSGQWVPPSDD